MSNEREPYTIDRITIKGVTYYLRDSSVIDGHPSGLPPVTPNDNGSILRVVDGVWAIIPVATAEEGTF